LGGEAGPVGSSWEAVLELCEPLGHENLLHFNLQGIPFVARAPVGGVFAAGQTLPVRIPPEKVRLFEGTTGELIVEQTAAAGV
jgi:ABC-type sugar transport system ATPase subunit